MKAFDGEIESHHVFPEAWCKQQGIPATRYNCLLNRTPLKKDTNRFIGAQPPSVYLARLVEQQGIPKRRVDEILRSHSIEPQTLWNDDFEAFLDSRFGNLSLLIEKRMETFHYFAGQWLKRMVSLPPYLTLQASLSIELLISKNSLNSAKLLNNQWLKVFC